MGFESACLFQVALPSMKALSVCHMRYILGGWRRVLSVTEKLNFKYVVNINSTVVSDYPVG